MIDVDKLERQASKATTGVVALTTEVFEQILAEMRSGHRARRELAKRITA